MKIVVIGGTGLIGSKVVAKLSEHGHEVVAASPDTGVNTLTGEGLADALDGAAVVVDVSNSPSFEDAAVLEFFETSTRNLLAAEAAAGVGHHVALSVVGTERLPESGYFRAQGRAGEADRAAPRSRTRSSTRRSSSSSSRASPTAATDGDTVRLAPVLIQPMAADDVAAAVGKVAVGAPLNGIVEVAGPGAVPSRRAHPAGPERRDDPRQVVADPHAPYFGAELERAHAGPGRRRPARRRSASATGSSSRRPGRDDLR